MSAADFHRHWTQVHAPLVRSCARALGIRRYTQLHTLEDAALHEKLRARNEGSPPPYDGFAELLYDQESLLLWSTPAGRIAAQRLLDDEKLFIDLTQSPMSLTHAWFVLEEQSEGVCTTHLIGSWSLHSWQISYTDGRPSRWPFGEKPKGQLLYGSDGSMSVTVIDPSAHLSLPSSLGSSWPKHELKRAPTFHYAGTYHCDKGRVAHDVDLSTNPALLGTRQWREAAIEGSTLTLRTTERSGGGTRQHRLVWTRKIIQEAS